MSTNAHELRSSGDRPRRSHGPDVAEQLLAFVAQDSSQAVILTDEAGRIEWANRGFEGIAGTAVLEAEGHALADVLARAGLQGPALAALRAALVGREEARLDTELLQAGHPRPLTVQVGPRAGGERGAGCLVRLAEPHHCGGASAPHFARDSEEPATEPLSRLPVASTAQRRPAELLDLKHALDEHAIVAVTDAASRIVEANDRFCTISGYTRAELIGATHRIVNSGCHPPEFFRDLWKTITSGGVWRGEICNRAKDGHLYWVYTTIVPFRGSDGRPVRYVAIRADITARKEIEASRAQLESQLYKAQQLEALGNFAGAVAHDFNNLLTGIHGHIELATGELPNDHAAVELLHTAERGCTRARELCQRLLSCARGENNVERHPLDLNALVRDLTPLLGAALGRNVSVRLQLGATMPPVLGDEGQLMQVLMNLCVNAGHAVAERRGTVTVVTDQCDVTPELARARDGRSGPHAVVRVADNGCGMSPATLARLFEPFFTTKPKGVGTGLGLTVVHRVVRDHGGFLRVSSEPGVGSTFEVLLPAVGAAVESQPPPAPAARPQRICVVDDEPEFLAAVVSGLKAAGYEVHSFDSASAATPARGAPAVPPDLALLDYNMPELSGLDLATRFRARHPAIPVVLMSGNVGRIDRERCRQLGGITLLEKPFDLPALFALLKRSLAPPHPK